VVKYIRLLVLFGVLTPLLQAIEPVAIYLTWVKDPTTTMVVQWQTPTGTTLPQLEYQIKGDSTWKSAKGQSQIVQDYDVHRVYLEGLTEDSVYLFKVQDSKREYSFQTMPKKLTRPVKMAIGGDAYHPGASEIFHRMNRMIAFNHPDFIVIGGDLAYTIGTKNLLKGPKWALARWQAFLRSLQRTIGQDGRLIPLLPLVGNHDVNKLINRTEKPELFYEIFTFPEMGKAYRSLDFGDYLSLVMLDTEHTWPVEGDQTVWLENTLKAKQSFPYLVAAYHIAAYPSHNPFTGNREELIRKNWVPLFEKYQVPFAFEHHNHAYKRTHPIKEGKVDPSGVTYLGDGSWGVPPRHINEKIWYLEKAASVNSCYIMTLSREKCLIEAKNAQGEIIDQVSRASLAPVSSD
jgi:hypothetical protein